MKEPKRLFCLVLALVLCLPLALSAGALASGEAETEPPAEADAPVLETVEPLYGAGTSDGPADNDARFAAYVETQFYGAPVTEGLPALDGHTTGDRLTGFDKAIYDILRGYIVEVAAGERVRTMFEIAPEDILGPSYTCEDLDAAFDALDASAGRIVDCLLADLPYELYWYDKTLGFEYSGFVYSYYSYGGQKELAEVTQNMTISFACMGEYALPFGGPGSYSLYDMNEDIDVSAAVSRARDIVAKYADASDYEKLVGYRKEICSLVSYNDFAAGTTGWYGDPWQLIYVFDGDAGTNVVCEGYAKAFQYLCDLTTFRSEDIDCYTVTGAMAGGTGAGEHMWNIVHMDDGKNYLVDVTNCDSGAVGAPDLLFLKGYASGSVSTQYNFRCGSSTISFAYDSGTRAIFEEAELTLSNKAYDPAAAATPTPKPTPEPTPEPTPQPTPVPPVPGDLNGDDAADGFDAALILRYAVRITDEIDIDAADLSGDGAADAIDAARILRK